MKINKLLILPLCLGVAPAWAWPRVPTATAPKLPAGVSQADWQQV